MALSQKADADICNPGNFVVRPAAAATTTTTLGWNIACDRIAEGSDTDGLLRGAQRIVVPKEERKEQTPASFQAVDRERDEQRDGHRGENGASLVPTEN